jgi:hypothetical protein
VVTNRNHHSPFTILIFTLLLCLSNQGYSLGRTKPGHFHLIGGFLSHNMDTVTLYVLLYRYENRIITDDSTCRDPFIGRDLTEFYDYESEPWRVFDCDRFFMTIVTESRKTSIEERAIKLKASLGSVIAVSSSAVYRGGNFYAISTSEKPRPSTL